MSVVCFYDTVVMKSWALWWAGRYLIILLMNWYDANMLPNVTIVSLTVGSFFPQLTCWHVERFKSWLNSILQLQFQSLCIVHTSWGLDKCRNRRAFSSWSLNQPPQSGHCCRLTRSMCWPGGWGRVAPAQLGKPTQMAVGQWTSEVESQRRDKIRLFGLKVCDYKVRPITAHSCFCFSTSCVTVDCRFHFSLMTSAAPLISSRPRPPLKYSTYHISSLGIGKSLFVTST